MERTLLPSTCRSVHTCLGLAAIFWAAIGCSSSPSGAPSGAGAGGGDSSGRTTNGGSSSIGGSSTSGGVLPAGGAGAGGAGALSSAGNGGVATGGSPADGGGTSQAGTAGTSPFVLSWQDDFNTLDSSAWELENFTYDGNEAQFTPQNASIINGVLTIALTPAPSGSAKPYLGVEMRSVKTLTYGKVSARMRFASGSGVVSGLVLFYTPFPNCNWNEIDIEHLGKVSTSSQLNNMVYTGTPLPNCTTSVTPTQDPQVTNLGFDAEREFHVYDIEWTPTDVKFFGDRVLLRTWNKNINLLALPQNILLTIWASNAASWAGAITPSSAPTSAEVDWIKVYAFMR